MLTVAAREVLARAATVAKVKAFILNVGDVGVWIVCGCGGWRLNSERGSRVDG